jgi:hypothetical protein
MRRRFAMESMRIILKGLEVFVSMALISFLPSVAFSSLRSF